MKTAAAVLHEMERPMPYADSRPMVIEELDLDGPGEGDVVEVKGAGLCHSDLSVINGSFPPNANGASPTRRNCLRPVGTGVRGLKPDDHVIFTFIPSCDYCRYARRVNPPLRPGAEAIMPAC